MAVSGAASRCRSAISSSTRSTGRSSSSRCSAGRTSDRRCTSRSAGGPSPPARVRRRGAFVNLNLVKVVLPDNSELELPDGATGLDAARAIGPKLADEAVLVRSNGHVQDLRLPLEDRQQIQILTTRDKDDPDALAVLRHSSAHLLA